MAGPRINRAQPVGPAAAYKTYQVTAPLSTHFRPATCAEVDCAAWRHGWRTVVDERTDLGMAQAAYIRAECVSASLPASPAGRARRRYTEHRDEHHLMDGTGLTAGSVTGLTTFEFAAGQPCFAKHEVPLERPELYIVRGGDWRGNPRGTPARRHTTAEDWVEDFAEHQDRLRTALERG